MGPTGDFVEKVKGLYFFYTVLFLAALFFIFPMYIVKIFSLAGYWIVILWVVDTYLLFKVVGIYDRYNMEKQKRGNV